jgi:uncharacterized membrane protein YccC
MLGFMGFTAFFMLAIDVALQGEAIQMHLLSTRLYDVAVGCVLALLGTLVATKWAETGNATLARGSGARENDAILTKGKKKGLPRS